MSANLAGGVGASVALELTEMNRFSDQSDFGLHSANNFGSK
jgi:hypothetical protein